MAHLSRNDPVVSKVMMAILHGLHKDLVYIRTRSTNDCEILELATFCGQHLIDRRINITPDCKVWQVKNAQKSLIGYGYGQAGIAASLAKLYTVIQEISFIEAALEAITYESNVQKQTQQEGNEKQKHLQPDDAIAWGWCDGTSGRGLAQLQLIGTGKLDATAQIKLDVEHTFQFVCTQTKALPDHVCCGESGVIDFLIEAALVLKRPEFMTEARQRMARLVNRKNLCDKYTLHAPDDHSIFNPAFFQGKAGIGYQMLRLIQPTEIISVVQ